MNHDELEKLHALKEAGYLTDEEFAAQKRAILTSDEPAAPAPVADTSTQPYSSEEAGDLIDRGRFRPFLLLIGIYSLLSIAGALFRWLAHETSFDALPGADWLAMFVPPGDGWIVVPFIYLLYVRDLIGPVDVLWYVSYLAATAVQVGAFALVLFRPIQRFSLIQQAVGIGLTASFAPMLLYYSSHFSLPMIFEVIGSAVDGAAYAAIIYWLLTRFGRSDAAAPRPGALR